MTTRKHVYLDDDKIKKLDEIVDYLSKSRGRVINKHRNKSETMGILIETFHQLFVEQYLGQKDGLLYYEQLFRLEKNLAHSDEQKLLKSIRHQLDQLLYLELTNFHALTKGNHFDIQDLESIHSHFDPKQNELIARIDDIIKEDVSRGQTIKYSH